MKQFFSESYSKICVDASREQLEMRWKGIEEYCEREKFDVYELVKLYYLLKTNDEFYQEFISVFHDIDISFNKNNKKELSVLAGNILVHLMEQAELKLDIIFSIICLSKYNIDVVVPEVIEKAYTSFGELSANTRELEITYKNVATKPLKDYALSLKDLAAIEQEKIADFSLARFTRKSCVKRTLNFFGKCDIGIRIVRKYSRAVRLIVGKLVHMYAQYGSVADSTRNLAANVHVFFFRGGKGFVITAGENNSGAAHFKLFF